MYLGEFLDNAMVESVFGTFRIGTKMIPIRLFVSKKLGSVFMFNFKICFLALALFIFSITGCSTKETEIPTVKSDAINADTTSMIITSKANIHDLAWAKSEFAKGYLEPDVIYPISHIMIRDIKSIGECEFVLHGFYGAELNDGTETYIGKYNMINSIEIRAISGEFYQLIDGLSTQLNVNFENYGFAFDDWNSDEFIDIRLHMCEGGSMRNEPSLFWLWDGNQSKFIQNEQLEEISSYSSLHLAPEEDKRIRSFTRTGAGEYSLSYYEYNDGEFVLVENKEVFFEKQDNALYQVEKVSKLIDGTMKMVNHTKTKIEQ